MAQTVPQRPWPILSSCVGALEMVSSAIFVVVWAVEESMADIDVR